MDALRLYDWNVQVSSAFHESLQYVEVGLRNVLDSHLTVWARARGAKSAWYIDPVVPLTRPTRDRVAEARRNATRAGLPETHGKVDRRTSARVLVDSSLRPVQPLPLAQLPATCLRRKGPPAGSALCAGYLSAPAQPHRAPRADPHTQSRRRLCVDPGYGREDLTHPPAADRFDQPGRDSAEIASDPAGSRCRRLHLNDRGDRLRRRRACGGGR